MEQISITTGILINMALVPICSFCYFLWHYCKVQKLSSKALDDGSNKNLTWGFDDSNFKLLPNTDTVVMTGNRYDGICNQQLPYLVPFLRDHFKLPNLARIGSTAREKVNVASWNFKIRNPQTDQIEKVFYEKLTAADIPFTTNVKERIRNAFGQSVEDCFNIFYDKGSSIRVYDLVISPITSLQVQQIVQLASTFGYKIVPVAGRTNVTMALKIPPEKENQVWIACNMLRMNKPLEIDKINFTATFQCGISGRDIEKYLNKQGYTIGHFPDSMEFSTLGGWVSTGASGMKKNKYGNIEEILKTYSMVTPTGTVIMGNNLPRVSEGIQDKNIFIGTEGNLGIITTATVKICHLPEKTVYDCAFFHNLEIGVMFLEKLVRSGLENIASVRLLDNTQFRMGQALKSKTGILASLKKMVEKWYVLNIKGFDPLKMVTCTFVFEGNEDQIAYQQKSVRRLVHKFNGMFAGAENGKRGYNLTMSIAYLRDFAAKFSILAESFETCVPWSSCPAKVIRAVVDKIHAIHKEKGRVGRPLIGGRVTQLYSTGVTLYFYLAYYTETTDRRHLHDYEEMVREARQVILKHGGSLSHHHGLGKVRGEYFTNLRASTNRLQILREIKDTYDPTDTFATHNGYLSTSHISTPVRSYLKI